MESFRAAEIGVYGSAIDLTPRFNEWAMKEFSSRIFTQMASKLAMVKSQHTAQ